MKTFTLLLLAFIIATSSSISWYHLVIHSNDRGAACLDGSPPGMYIHEGSGKNKDKFLIYFPGGGFCGGETLSKTI